MLLGEFSHSIDEKGRLIIPAKLRDDLGDSFVICNGLEGCLFVYSQDEWNKFVNKEYFMDPNNVPESVQDKVKRFTEYLMNYIYVPYLPFDRIYRLKNFKRRTVTIIDTDSNILALDTWVNYTIDHVLQSSYGRDKLKNVFIAVNTLTYVITTVVQKILLLYGEYANIPEDYRPKLNMKNELEQNSSCKISLIAGNSRYDSITKLRQRCA